MNEKFPERLREIREQSGLSQTDFAKKIGISRASLSYYENGTRTPDIYLLRSLHEATGVSIYYLLGISDTKNDAFVGVRYAIGLSEEVIELLDSENKNRGQRTIDGEEPDRPNLIDVLNSLLSPETKLDEFLRDVYTFYHTDFSDPHLIAFDDNNPDNDPQPISGCFAFHSNLKKWRYFDADGDMFERAYLDKIRDDLSMRKFFYDNGRTPFEE